MKTVSAGVTAQATANQSGWAEIYDIYLNTAIVTPYGTTSIIRITQCPGGLSFFTPLAYPEPAGTQGNAASYYEWPAKRQIVKAATRFMNDKLSVVVSNVTGDYASMLNAVKWRNRPIVIRKVPLTMTSPAATDCVTYFAGTIDSAKITDEQVQFVVSNGLGSFNVYLPRENMHTNCRAQWADDLCGTLRFKAENYKSKTCGAGSTTSFINSAGLNEDGATNRNIAHAATVSTSTDFVTLASSGAITVNNGELLFLNGLFLPTLNPVDTTMLPLYAINCNSAGFQLAMTPGGPAVTFNTAGTAVTIAQADIASTHAVALYTAKAVTVSTVTNIVSVTGGSSTVNNNDVIFFGGTTVPKLTVVLTPTTPLYAVGCGSGGATTFQLWFTPNGGNLDFVSAGVLVTVTTAGLYGPDLINNLSTGAITASSQQTGFEAYRVQQNQFPTNHWRFSTTAGNPSTAVNTTAPYLVFDLGSAKKPDTWNFTNGPAGDVDFSSYRVITWYGSTDNASWYQMFQYNQMGVNLHGLPLGTSRVLIPNPQAFRYWKVVITKAGGQPFFSCPMGKITAAIGAGADLINALANGSITSSDETAGFEGYRVKTGQTSYWAIGAPAADQYGLIDWGVNYQGYWQIPDLQAGLKNPTLKPYIQFDFGSAVTPKVWRFQSVPNVPPQDIPRVVAIFSSTVSNFATYTFEQYFGMPNSPGVMYDCLIPKASTARYWRICVRSTWAEMVDYIMFSKIRAHAAARNWWASGRVTFDGNTTAALAGVSRSVLESYSGQLVCVPLPVAPAAGDTFTIERGCPGTYNGCNERRNMPNFAGFDTMPDQTLIQ